MAQWPDVELRVALASARSRRKLTSRHEETRPISRGYGATLARRDALDPATRRVVDDEISADLLDELRDWSEAAQSADGRIAACVGALVDFAATGGPAADIWFSSVRSGSLDARDRRADVLVDIAHLMFHCGTGPRLRSANTRELLVLGGVLEILSTRLRDRDHLLLVHAKPELVSLVWRQTS